METETNPRTSRVKICAACDQTHDASKVVAMNRFRPEGPSGYRTPDGVIHPTREAGHAHLCAQQRVDR